jgi:hypothetical protein
MEAASGAIEAKRWAAFSDKGPVEQPDIPDISNSRTAERTYWTETCHTVKKVFCSDTFSLMNIQKICP